MGFTQEFVRSSAGQNIVNIGCIKPFPVTRMFALLLCPVERFARPFIHRPLDDHDHWETIRRPFGDHSCSRRPFGDHPIQNLSQLNFLHFRHVCKGIETAKVLDCWWLLSLLFAEHVCPGDLDYYSSTF